MSEKTERVYTREEFDHLLRESAAAMAADAGLLRDALNVIVRADRYRWIHQTNWFGEPILQLPQDMFALQEIIFQSRPRFVIEVGVAWGGSLLFYSTLMHALGGDRIIGIDVFIPEDLKNRLGAFGAISEKITLINGSSIAESTLEQVKSLIDGCREVLIVLDSNHTHEHVLSELRLYSPLVGKGYYLVCGDTIIEDIPEQTHRLRPWGPGNNPKTAMNQFLNESDRFETDRKIENKLLFTCNPKGFLRCIKD